MMKRNASKESDPDWKSVGKKKCNDSHKRCLIHMEDSKFSNFTSLTESNKDNALKKLKEIANARLKEERHSSYRMESVCRFFLAFFDTGDIKVDSDGWHRDCYQRYTSNLNRLAEWQTSKSSSETTTRREKRQSSEGEKIIFNPDCIFCNKVGKISVKKKGYKTTEGTTVFDREGGPAVQKHAEYIEDESLLTRIRGYNLFSCEARYHPTCRKRFMNIKNEKSSSWRSQNEETKSLQAERERIHKAAFQKVSDVIKEEILEKQGILKFYTLLDMYKEVLRGTDFENDKYRVEKLKNKIENDDALSSKVVFCWLEEESRKQKYVSCLLYSKEMTLTDAVRESFNLGLSLTDKVKETAKEIRSHILNAFKEHSTSAGWPPKVEDLLDSKDLVPPSLQKLLLDIISSSNTTNSEKVERLMLSISQDICRAATKSQWNMPKHILLGMGLRHLFRSAEVTVILNRFGHLPDYCFLLELESAIAKASDEKSHLLTNQIVRNPECRSVFHSDFDNFDQFTNELTGAGSVHRAHGIMLQELITDTDESIGGSIPVTQPQTRTGQRSYKFERQHKERSNVYMGVRKNPPLNITYREIPGGPEEFQLMQMQGHIWILLRAIKAEAGPQEYPGWSGYVSLSGTPPTRLTTIDYYPVIPEPITDYSTVVETLDFAEQATKEVGQEYCFVTYDLGVCLKAYPLVWNHPGKYKKHIVLIGTFHIVCAYIKMVGKKMRGSGFTDILLESGLMTSGSMVGVISGKGYCRAMNCHKTLLEGLERLLLQKFFQSDDVEIQTMIQNAKTTVLMYDTQPNNDFKSLVSNNEIISLVKRFQCFREEAKNWGPTSKFWLSYVDHIWLILSLLHAVKTKNYLEYANCMSKLPDLFFAFGGQNYARYLTYFGVFLANIDESHPGALELIKSGVFSIARSFIPGSRSATDKTIEETFMKHAKSRSGSGQGTGLIGILNNEDAYQRWVKTASERAKYYQATLQMAGLGGNSGKGSKHKETRASEIRKSETHVSDIIHTITDYINPFDMVDDGKLYCLSSGCPVTEDIMIDVLRAEEEGKKTKEEFIEFRLGSENEEKVGKNGEGIFFDKIPRLKLKTMDIANSKVSITRADNKVVKYRQDGSFVFNLLVQLEKMGTNVDLRNFVSYPLTPIPYSIGTYDGFLAKTNKSKAFHWLIKNMQLPNLPASDDQTLVIEDGNAIFHCLSDLPDNFKLISEKIFNMASSFKHVLFSTDMYRRDSVKSMERIRRGVSNTLIIGGPKTKKPSDWKDFLKNNDNKKRLIEVILKVWSSQEFSSRLIDRDMIFICEEKATLLSLAGGKLVTTNLEEIESDQEETDTRVVLYCLYAKKIGYKNVIVRTPDSDLFFILLNYIHKLDGLSVFFETGKKNKKRLVDLTSLSNHFNPEYCEALLGLHAFTGCDSTSAFKGKGKVRAVKWMQKDEDILHAAAGLGNEWNVSDDIISGLERLACRLYGMPRINDVNECRYLKLTSVCCPDDLNVIHPTKKFDTAFIPPPRVSFVEHVKRANYEVAKWKRSHLQFPLIQSPFTDNGWMKDDDGILHPVWYSGKMLPESILNELPTDSEDGDVSDDDGMDDDVDIDYSEFIEELFNETDEEEYFWGFSDDEDS